jgi:hypothetical protein
VADGSQCVADALRCDKQQVTGDKPTLGVVHSWRSTFWYIGFPLLECGPTGPLGPSAVLGPILTSKHEQETRSGSTEVGV